MTQNTRHIILDTDIGGDCDDVGALAMLHALADAGSVHLIGVAVSNPDRYATPAVSAINTFFGRPDIPVATIRPVFENVPKPPTPGAAVASTNVSGYAAEISRTWPSKIKTAEEALDPTPLYRQLLTQATEPVTLVVIGGQINLAQLLDSSADHLGPDGAQLVADTVDRLIIMGGEFPSGREWNIRLEPAAARQVAEAWPTPIIYTGYELGGPILTGSRLFAADYPDSPVRDAYRLHGAVGWGGQRNSWDQSAVWLGVNGPEPYFSLSPPGKIKIDPDGSNQWSDDPAGTHRYTLPKAPTADVATRFDSLMAHLPLDAPGRHDNLPGRN